MDSIKFYLRFNWIYEALDCKKNWFLIQFRLLLNEIKVLGSNYNFEELIWLNQGLNCIINEVWWSIGDLIETIQTGKGTKIKGSNYNLSRGLDYKIVKNIQRPNQKISIFIGRRCRFKAIFRHLSSKSFQQIMEPFQQQKQQIALVMGNVSRLRFLYVSLSRWMLHRRAFFGL